MLGNELTVPTGIETAPTSPQLTRSTGAWKVILASLRDQTDRQPEVLQESEWLLGATAPALKLRGNAFAVEHAIDGTGRVFLCLAPLPDSRAIPSDWDLQVGPDGTVTLNQENEYSWVHAAYSGGRWGRIAAAHALQRTLRPYDPRVHGLFMTNTWGDRARDAHLNSDFLLRELTAAEALGVEVVEIDDGWQKGTSANSSKSGGIWNGFWEGDPQFWDVNPERFPDGLDAIAAQARKEGLKLGLWFAPDSSGEAKNWSRDAEALLRIHRELGVDFFKIDALKITTAASEENYRRLLPPCMWEPKLLLPSTSMSPPNIASAILVWWMVFSLKTATPISATIFPTRRSGRPGVWLTGLIRSACEWNGSITPETPTGTEIIRSHPPAGVPIRSSPSPCSVRRLAFLRRRISPPAI